MCVCRDSEEMLVYLLPMFRLANALAANARTQFCQVVDPNKIPLQLS